MRYFFQDQNNQFLEIMKEDLVNDSNNLSLHADDDDWHVEAYMKKKQETKNKVEKGNFRNTERSG